MAQMEHETLTLGGLKNVAFSPKGQQVLTQSADGSASLWDVATGRQVRMWLKGSSLSSVAFSRDGARVFIGVTKRCSLSTFKPGRSSSLSGKVCPPVRHILLVPCPSRLAISTC